MLELLDTVGAEEYIALRNLWIKSSNGILLIYSIASKESFEKLRSIWLQIKEVKERQGEWQGFPILLVGNKTDLEEQREVSTEEGRILANSFGCCHAECSAKMAFNVHEIMYNLVRKIRMKTERTKGKAEEIGKVKGKKRRGVCGGGYSLDKKILSIGVHKILGSLVS